MKKQIYARFYPEIVLGYQEDVLAFENNCQSNNTEGKEADLTDFQGEYSSKIAPPPKKTKSSERFQEKKPAVAKVLTLTFLLFFTFSWQNLFGLTVHSSNGYSVNITLTQQSVQTTNYGGSSCGFRVSLEYDITFSGNNIPANLWTLQGRLFDEGGSFGFYSLPNGGGAGTTMTSNATYYGNCDDFSLNAGIEITVQGPGISYQTLEFGGLGTVEYPFSTLPVELAAFKARAQEDHTLIEWITASESGNEGFYVQRSISPANEKSWESIGFVPGQGNSIDEHGYSFLDKSPASGVNYYRLKQLDFDGTISYSKVFSLVFESTVTDWKIYPNPTTTFLQIKGFETSSTGHPSSYRIFNLYGQLMAQGKWPGTDGINVAVLDQGMYVLELSARHGAWTSRFLKK